MEKRRLRLSDAEKNEMIIDQKNRCPLSGSPIFVGDDVEVDHIEPISLGGLDVKANVQMTHKEENRKKGSSIK